MSLLISTNEEMFLGGDIVSPYSEYRHIQLVGTTVVFTNSIDERTIKGPGMFDLLSVAYACAL